jgi:protein SCO1/2
MARSEPRALARLAALSLVLLAAPAAADTRAQDALRASQAAIGRSVSDFRMTDHLGRPVSLRALTDKPLVVSFIYTGCFQVCPTTTQFLKRAVDEARAALGAESFRVVSIGFNQPFDTPEALAAFARQQGIRDPGWLFLAPREQDVERLLAEFGLTVTPTAGGFDHLIQASLVGRDGVIRRQVYGEGFELPMFVAPLKDLIANAEPPRLSLDDIWLRVKLYCTVYDPASGKYRFDYTLFVELFAGITFLGALLWFVVRELMRRPSAVGRRP